ncbi:MAG: hypothetical protein D6737_09650 [Chloroflexi bacterium]|nr:MAG: hypothetical protein D6737_09650 [Chloroflexota bacterium]
MLQTMLKPSAMTITWFVLLIGVVRVLPFYATPTQDVLLSDGCPLPCWQGIQPGVTTVEEAVIILNAHRWVDGVSRGIGVARMGAEDYREWRWDYEAFPLAAGSESPLSFLTSENDVVTSITLNTNLRLADIWAAFGAPPQHSATILPLATGDFMFRLQAFYPDAHLIVRSSFLCPTALTSFWQWPISIELTTKTTLEPLSDRQFEDFYGRRDCAL